MEQNAIDFKALYRHLRQDMRRIRRLRRLVRCLVCLLYPAVLCWFAFCLFGGFLVDHSDYEVSVRTGQYVMVGFALFCLLHYLFMWSFRTLSRQETAVMGDILARLFPSASYLPSGSLPPQLLADSRLFGVPSSPDVPLSFTGYGRLDIPVDDGCISIADVGVTTARQKDFASLTVLEMLYQSLVRPIFGVRIESTLHSFRGMFGCCRLQRSFRGCVLLLPDHLENKLGYWAQTIQGFRQKYGAKFVYLEDPEFERLFVVYADDEVEARKVLTPAMMRRLTELRRSFSRDLMFAFHGDRFYYASETPDGFLRPGRRSLKDEALLEQLYHEIEFCRFVREHMK